MLKFPFSSVIEDFFSMLLPLNKSTFKLFTGVWSKLFNTCPDIVLIWNSTVSLGWALRVVAMIEIMIKRRLTAENLQNNRMIGYALS